MATVRADQIDFKAEAVTRDKGHYIPIKGSILQRDPTVTDTHAPHTRAPRYVRQTGQN